MDKLFRQKEFAELYRSVPDPKECKNLSEAITSIAPEYELSIASPAEKEKTKTIFGYFDSFKGHEVEHLISVLKVKKSNLFFDLIIVGLDFSEQRSAQGRSKVIEYEMLALVNINKDLGKVFISPESFADKISEFFNPIEIDFPEDKAFSDKYYVLSGDAGKVKNNLSAGLRKAISNFDNLYLECSDAKMIIRVQDEISVENTKTIFHAAFNILKSL
jgi:hypothetical protein